MEFLLGGLSLEMCIVLLSYPGESKETNVLSRLRNEYSVTISFHFLSWPKTSVFQLDELFETFLK